LIRRQHHSNEAFFSCKQPTMSCKQYDLFFFHHHLDYLQFIQGHFIRLELHLPSDQVAEQLHNLVKIIKNDITRYLNFDLYLIDLELDFNYFNYLFDIPLKNFGYFIFNYKV
jgi:hypothetical protein